MSLSWSQQKSDPRYQRAGSLFDAMSADWRLTDGHARTNLRYAVCMSVLSPEESDFAPERHAALLSRTIERYIVPAQRAAVLEKCERIVRSVLADASA